MENKNLNVLDRPCPSCVLIIVFVFAALSNDAVWAEGLLIFYELFRFLEEAMDRLNHSLIGELDIEGMRRTSAFKKDLEFYLGKNWERDYKPPEKVSQYVLYLKDLENTNPYMLMAYVYHLYMGLLSGGQILKKKRQFFAKYIPLCGSGMGADQGYEVTDFGNRSISQIKRELVKAMNGVADNLDEETKQQLITESRTLFLKNNEIIKTVQGATNVLLKKLAWLIFLLILVWFAFKIVF